VIRRAERDDRGHGFGQTALARTEQQSPDSLCLQALDDRLNGRLSQVISLRALAGRYQVGERTARRMARQLQQRGLATFDPLQQAIAFLVGPRAAASRDIRRLRMMLEPAVLLEPGFDIPKPQLAQCEREHRLLLDSLARFPDPGSAAAKLATLHWIVLGAANNRFAYRVFEQAQTVLRVLSRRQAPSLADIGAHCEEHLYLLALLRQREFAEAAHILRQHLWENALCAY